MSRSVTYEEVLRTARSLDESDRVRLVDDLIGTLGPVEAAPLDDAWLAEIDRRSAELEAGAVQTIPWSQVRRQAWQRASRNG
jgi:putative addiction module component (TIGR02574 family)